MPVSSWRMVPIVICCVIGFWTERVGGATDSLLCVNVEARLLMSCATMSRLPFLPFSDPFLAHHPTYPIAQSAPFSPSAGSPASHGFPHPRIASRIPRPHSPTLCACRSVKTVHLLRRFVRKTKNSVTRKRRRDCFVLSVRLCIRSDKLPDLFTSPTTGTFFGCFPPNSQGG